MNILMMIDPVTGDEVLPIEVLTNLSRFNQVLGKVDGLVARIYREGILSDAANDFRNCAIDFYNAWQASSTMVVQEVGREETIFLFKKFREIFPLSWPDASLDFLEELGHPESVTVFRGESPELVAAGIRGISWSLSEGVAAYYANRHDDGVVLRGDVAFDDVLAIFQEELEVVVEPEAVVLDSDELVVKSGPEFHPTGNT